MAHLSDSQRTEAENDLLLADIELRLEQLRSMRRYGAPLGAEDWAGSRFRYSPPLPRYSRLRQTGEGGPTSAYRYQ
jgi:hypothetical protein